MIRNVCDGKHCTVVDAFKKPEPTGAFLPLDPFKSYVCLQPIIYEIKIKTILKTLEEIRGVMRNAFKSVFELFFVGFFFSFLLEHRHPLLAVSAILNAIIHVRQIIQMFCISFFCYHYYCHYFYWKLRHRTTDSAGFCYSKSCFGIKLFEIIFFSTRR